MDLACRLCSYRIGIYLRVSAVVLLPCFAGCLALLHFGAAGWVWTWTLALGLGTLAQGAFTILTGRLLFSRTLRAREVLGAYARRLPSYFGAILVTRILLSLSIITAGVILPFLWMLTLFVHEASLLEGASPIEAARRSWRFIRGRGAHAFVVLLLLLIAQGGAIAGAELLGQGVVDGLLQLGKPLGTFTDGGTPFMLLGYFASLPFVATARFLQYIDVRTRADGWDVQVRFMSVVASEAARERRAAA